MNKDSNKFIVIFASVMVIVVALILSFAHEILKGTQKQNEDMDKMSQILRSIKVNTSGNETKTAFEKFITDMYMVDSEGNIIQDTKDDAFSADLKTELAKKDEEKRLPVYVAQIDGETKYIMALYGAGLWGPLWGYIAINEDGNSVYGADFSHDSETPGLGAEISQSWFSDRFTGKHLFRNGNFTSIAVVKQGKNASDKDYIDGISGGTITGRGVDEMLYNSLKGYSIFLSKLNKH